MSRLGARSRGLPSASKPSSTCAPAKQYAAKLGERAVLLDEVMESLMTEHDVGTGVGQRQFRAVAVQHVDIGDQIAAGMGGLRGKRERRLVKVDADKPPRFERFGQQTE